jgi:hypothetical protein
MNAVTLRNFSLPLRIATFEKDLFAGFSLVCTRALQSISRLIRARTAQLAQ